MSLLKSYGRDNMLIEEGLSFRFELDIVSPTLFNYKRIVTKRYSYHGMTRETAFLCAANKAEKYRLKLITGDTVQVATCTVGRDPAGWNCTIDIRDDVEVASSQTIVDDPESLFIGLTTPTDYDESVALEISNLRRIGVNEYTFDYRHDIVGFVPNAVAIELSKDGGEFHFRIGAVLEIASTQIRANLPDLPGYYSVRVRYGDVFSNSLGYVGVG